jgi:hypothetical protein
VAAGIAWVSAVPPANDSFKRPQSPLGSAAVTAIPANIGLCSSNVHSSLVKSVLSDIASSICYRKELLPCCPSRSDATLVTQIYDFPVRPTIIDAHCIGRPIARLVTGTCSPSVDEQLICKRVERFAACSLAIMQATTILKHATTIGTQITSILEIERTMDH